MTSATLIYNPRARGAASLPLSDLEVALRVAGYEPEYRATDAVADLDAALRDPGEVVVVAGGDGTIRAAALRLLGRGVPLAPLPLGTANNICRALGLSGPPLDVALGLGRSECRPFDVGRVRAPWGEDHFLEACGCGLYADTLAAYDPAQGKSVTRALAALGEVLGARSEHAVRASLDGMDCSGHVLLLEILNTPAAGPRLHLAPDASPHDGWLDVVRVRAHDLDSILGYTRALLGGHLHDLDSVDARRGRCLTLCWDGRPLHVDGEVRPRLDWAAQDTSPSITVELLPGALTMLVPLPTPVEA